MSDLTDRMRTCAVFINTWHANDNADINDMMTAFVDAAELLVEAATEIERLTGPVDLGEPMEVIPPVAPQAAAAAPAQNDLWIAPGGALPGLKRSGTVSPRACPNCGSRATKSVHRVEKRMMLECPICAHRWAYK